MLALLLLTPLQTTWIVDSQAPGPGSGTALDPYASVTYALAQPSTVSGDSVLVLPGTYAGESIDFLGKNVAVRSSAGAAVTRLESVPLASGPASVVRVVSGEGPGTLLEGFTVAGLAGDPGRAPFGTAGGAVACVQSSIELRDLVIAGAATSPSGEGSTWTAVP